MLVSRSSLIASAVLRVREAEAAAGVPLGALVAVRGDPPGVAQHTREVEQVPGQKRGVAVREVVLGAARALIEVARPWAGLAEPRGVGLRRDRVAQVLQRVEDVHRTVLGAILVAGDDAAAHPAVVGVLAGLVEYVAVAVQPLDHPRADR